MPKVKKNGNRMWWKHVSMSNLQAVTGDDLGLATAVEGKKLGGPFNHIERSVVRLGVELRQHGRMEVQGTYVR